MIERLLAELEEGSTAYVDTLEQASAVIEAATLRWPETTALYGWDCRADYDDRHKRWRFQIVCLTPFGIPGK